MRTPLHVLPLATLLSLGACGTLERKSVLVSHGDNKEQVLRIMGTPHDRQFLGVDEVWQYCVTGAGFGYHDYRMIWFYEGAVTGITSYKDSTPGASCRGQFRSVRWEDAPDRTIEVRAR